MKKDADLLDWIDRYNTEQTQWVNEYLSRHIPSGYLWLDNQSSAMAIFGYNNRDNPHPLSINSDLKLLVGKMRAAWRQKLFRSKQNGKKTYSFVMSTTVEKKLKAMSGKGKIRETLEALILQEYDKHVPKIENLNESIKTLRKELSGKNQENLKLKGVNKELNQKIEMKDKEIAKQKHDIKNLNRENADLSNQLKQLQQKHNNKQKTHDDMTTDNKNTDT